MPLTRAEEDELKRLQLRELRRKREKERANLIANVLAALILIGVIAWWFWPTPPTDIDKQIQAVSRGLNGDFR
jgi:hypothetical protein